jgi:hypothetical protein
MRRGRSSRSGATRPTEAEDRCRDRVLTRASASDPRRAARGRIGGKEEEARFRASGKHHRGVASAEAEMKGWCLPSSSGILALSHQQAPTRGDTTDATIPRPGCSRSQLEAGGAVRERQTPGAECDRDPWPGSHRGDPDDPRSQAALPRGGHPERLAPMSRRRSWRWSGATRPRTATRSMPTGWRRSSGAARSSARCSKRPASSPCCGNVLACTARSGIGHRHPRPSNGSRQVERGGA